MKKQLIIVSILIIVAILGVLLARTIMKELKVEPTVSNNIVNKNVNSVKNNVVNNTTNEINNENTNSVENVVIDNPEPEKPKTDLEKAIDIVKEDWGEDDTVYFAEDGKSTNGEYIICVRDKASTAERAWYWVDVINGTFTKEHGMNSY